MGKAMQADTPSKRAGSARQVAKKQKARLKRRAWKDALRKGEDMPKHSAAHDGHYRGYLS